MHLIPYTSCACFKPFYKQDCDVLPPIMGSYCFPFEMHHKFVSLVLKLGLYYSSTLDVFFWPNINRLKLQRGIIIKMSRSALPKHSLCSTATKHINNKRESRIFFSHNNKPCVGWSFLVNGDDGKNDVNIRCMLMHSIGANQLLVKAVRLANLTTLFKEKKKNKQIDMQKKRLLMTVPQHCIAPPEQTHPQCSDQSHNVTRKVHLSSGRGQCTWRLLQGDSNGIAEAFTHFFFHSEGGPRCATLSINQPLNSRCSYREMKTSHHRNGSRRNYTSFANVTT